MAEETSSSSCTITCWSIAVLAGLGLGAMLVVLGDFGYIQAIFTSVIVTAVLGVVLARFICSASSAKADLAAVRRGEAGAAAAAPKASATAAATAPSAADQPAAQAAATSANVSTAPAKPAAEKPAAKEAPAKAAAKSASAKTAAPKATKAKAPAAEKAKIAPVAADGKPETFMSPRAGGADDLKLISGVGPKLESTLNELGFWHFDQIASWRKKEIDWVDSRLKFKGRIERDDWIAQAKILAAGGETEFSKKKRK